MEHPIPLFTPDVSRFPTRFDVLDGGSFQKEMREAFIAQANEVLSKISPPSIGGAYRLGIEMEFSVVDADCNPLPQWARDETVVAFKDEHRFGVSYEVGASQIEITTNPIDVQSTSAIRLLADMQLGQSLVAQHLATHNGRLLRIGANPFASTRGIACSVGREKYLLCPKFHQSNQRPGLDVYIGHQRPVYVGDAGFPSITNSVQLNFDVSDPYEGITMLNYALAFSPLATAFGANAGFLDCVDTGFSDIRYIAWQVSHDIRTWEEVALGKDTRVGIPSRYYRDVNDYLSSALSHPFFMRAIDAAFPMGIGIYWRDARMKFLEKSHGVQTVVELRPVSTQPTARDDFAIMMFYFGRIQYAARHNEPLLPIEVVRSNKERVMRLGREAIIGYLRNGEIVYTSCNGALREEAKKAIAGLSEFGIDAQTLAIVEEYVNDYAVVAPVDRLRTRIDMMSHPFDAKEMKEAVNALHLLV